MIDILVLYYSRTGTLERLADLVARGVGVVDGCRARVRVAPPVSPVTEAVADSIPEEGPPYVSAEDFRQCRGLALGSPARFGSMAAPLKYVLDQTGDTWHNGDLTGKPAAVFTASSSMHGGQETTLLSMMVPLLHHGMVVVGLPYTLPDLHYTKGGGSPYGAGHVTGSKGERSVDAQERALLLALGTRLARAAMALTENRI